MADGTLAYRFGFDCMENNSSASHPFMSHELGYDVEPEGKE